MTSAALRRKWIYDNEQFVRGRIWSLEESAVQSLIELITTTIAPTTWDEAGGPGSIKEFETNLSLVISQALIRK